MFYSVFCPFRTLGRHGSNHSKNRDKISALELGVSSSEVVKDATETIPNTATATIKQTKPVTPIDNPCPFTCDMSRDSKRKLALKEFDEKVRKAIPSVDKALITRSGYHQSLLRVSWNLIESEILHSPGKKEWWNQYLLPHHSCFLVFLLLKKYLLFTFFNKGWIRNSFLYAAKHKKLSIIQLRKVQSQIAFLFVFHQIF